ncbi:hypothetical protein DFH08DRAFT_969071 [Mycena albidolilacea]|uniref:LysM domain-containing protein n=1 Tax=Mycena albidolilacea TaxID=1033008 RepID=A0AAD7EHD7_9AGAR|nr:hypothetical protein DFH08DRAFT_969071 [Mycena albidolilacea]
MFPKISFALLVTALAISASPLEARQSCSQTHTVVSGDTCSSIESAQGISDAQLHAMNPSINTGCTNLQIGEVLCLSGGPYVHNGIATYYFPNGAIGTCGGLPLNNNDLIVAPGAEHWNGGSHCGEIMTISGNGHSVRVVVRDLCRRCQGANGIDLTPGGISQLDPNYMVVGVINVLWGLPTLP